MNCIARLKKRSLLSLCYFAFCLCAWASDSGGAALTDAQKQAIRSELNSIRQELGLLRTLSRNLQTDSEAWRNKCSLLEKKLTSASQELENSGKSVIELQETVRTLRGLLEELKSDYDALNQSYMRQKKATRFRRTTAVIAILISVGGGLAHFLSR